MEQNLKKRVAFSFDDAREDTYTRAWPILERYKFPATVNVISDFVLHPEQYREFGSGCNRAMTAEQLREWQAAGMEIACHGSTHQNSPEDILQNITELRDMGLDVDGIGFASPHSELTAENAAAVRKLVEEGILSYIRSGIQVRREGLVYCALTVLEQKTHSPWLFARMNRRNILPAQPDTFFRSVTITRQTTVEQVMALLNSMAEGESVVLMFHSICNRNDPGYGKDKWFWDADRLEHLCSFLTDSRFAVCTTQTLLCTGF